MSNNEETGPSDQDADEMDYEGEQDYLDFLTATTRNMSTYDLLSVTLEELVINL